MKKIFCSILCGLLLLQISLPSFALITTMNTKEKISLNFSDVPIRDILQIFSQFNGLNVIVSDSVKGHITIHLSNIAWDKALEIILKSQGLSQLQLDNTLLIAPAEEITLHQEHILQIQQDIKNLLPLQFIVLPLNYSKATDIANLLKDKSSILLSSRGQISADARTNTILIQDIAENIKLVRKFIQQIDIPVKEVLIEARIVNIDEKYEHELGVRFGITRPGNNLSGTLSSANEFAKGQSNELLTDPLKRLNVDLPATQTGEIGGAATIGMALAKITNSNLLDLELSALESQGGGEIISSPKLMTANQQTATILSGQEIPYQQSTSSGATSINFQKAVLSLNVTPQITPNNKLILNLQVSQDRPGTTLVQGVPTIDTRQIQTQVLVNSGETIVLGGIYEQAQQKQIEQVPFLGKLPIIGALFRHTLTKNNRKELLIFITPQIM